MKTQTEIILVEVCGACPESYDAFIDEQYVGYFRLRSGIFTVDTIDGIEVFRGYPNGDGLFEYDEREQWLNLGKTALKQFILNQEPYKKI